MSDEVKTTLTEVERLQLAKKLDEDLDEYIAGLEKRSKTEEWKDPSWEKDLLNHPFFMSKLAEGEEVSNPLLEGLQKLKYDPEENTPEELALAYKEDGNFNFKHNNYRLAVLSYTEGIKQKISDLDLVAQLYNNRAASQFRLKNYRSCHNDCKKALQLKPDYMKCKIRLAQALYEMGRVDESLEVVNEIERYQWENNITDDKLQKLRKDIVTKAVQRKHEEGVERVKKAKEQARCIEIIKAIKQRGIRSLKDEENWQGASTLFPEVFRQGVKEEEGRLIWPVVLMYPEYKLSDFIQSFHEDSTFKEQFDEVFSESPEWDIKKEYTTDSVSLFFEDENGNVYSVDKNLHLGTILSLKEFRVDRGVPAFIILVKGSAPENEFLQQHHLRTL